MERILKLTEVVQVTGNSRSKIYAEANEGLFPPPIKTGLRASGWIAREVDAVNRARVAGWGDEEIRGLVRRLKASRSHALDDVVEAQKVTGSNAEAVV
jgi:prophage regulatory protein